jgi:hypothetical protein
MRFRIAIVTALLLGLAPSTSWSQKDPAVDPTASLPFAIELEPVTIPSLSPLQSYAQARSGSRWLLVCGRTQGLHQFVSSGSGGTPPPNAFPASSANGRIYVLDPSAKTIASASIESLPGPISDALGATNIQSAQRGDRLYIIGGYGRDSSTGAMTTFPTVTSINVPALIDAVIKGTDLAPHFEQVLLQQTVTTSSVPQTLTFRLTGGELERIGDDFYLVFGQEFRGLYSVDPGDFGKWPLVQQYSERIFVLSIADGPLKVTIKTIINADPNDPTSPYHRRDLNVLPTRDGNGQPNLTAYGGVFVPGQNSAYRNPVRITGPAPDKVVVDTTFAQALSQYDCAAMTMFDATSGTLYTTFFGGISLYYLDPKTHRVKEDTGLPFIKDISTIVRDKANKSTQLILPTRLPGYLGAEMRFLADQEALHPGELTLHPDNGVLSFDQIKTRTAVGYLYGGIEAAAPQTEGDVTKSHASSTLLRVWVTPKATPCILAPTTP